MSGNGLVQMTGGRVSRAREQLSAVRRGDLARGRSLLLARLLAAGLNPRTAFDRRQRDAQRRPRPRPPRAVTWRHDEDWRRRACDGRGRLRRPRRPAAAAIPRRRRSCRGRRRRNRPRWTRRPRTVTRRLRRSSKTASRWRSRPSPRSMLTARAVDAEGRLVVLLLDNVVTAPVWTTHIKTIAHDFANHMSPHDVAAVVMLNEQRHQDHDESGRDRNATIETFRYEASKIIPGDAVRRHALDQIRGLVQAPRAGTASAEAAGLDRRAVALHAHRSDRNRDGDVRAGVDRCAGRSIARERVAIRDRSRRPDGDAVPRMRCRLPKPPAASRSTRTSSPRR